RSDSYARRGKRRQNCDERSSTCWRRVSERRSRAARFANGAVNEFGAAAPMNSSHKKARVGARALEVIQMAMQSISELFGTTKNGNGQSEMKMEPTIPLEYLVKEGNFKLTEIGRASCRERGEIAA